MNKVTCPICGRALEGRAPAELPAFPFCGERCRLIDLGRWLGEKYRIAPEAEGGPPAGVDETETP